MDALSELNDLATSTFSSVTGFEIASTTEFSHQVMGSFIGGVLVFLNENAAEIVSYGLIVLMMSLPIIFYFRWLSPRY